MYIFILKNCISSTFSKHLFKKSAGLHMLDGLFYPCWSWTLSTYIEMFLDLNMFHQSCPLFVYCVYR